MEMLTETDLAASQTKNVLPGCLMFSRIIIFFHNYLLVHKNLCAVPYADFLAYNILETSTFKGCDMLGAMSLHIFHHYVCSKVLVCGKTEINIGNSIGN